jgi:leukotriene-A4 hydrolase
MNIFKYLFLVTILILLSCNSNKQNEIINSSSYTHNTIRDAHSYANIDEIRTTHLHLDLDVNFENKTIYGIARHTMENSGVDTAIFDIKGLEIQKITIGEKGNEDETDYIIGKDDEILGAPLSVKINENTQHINIYYKTTENSSAIDWLGPELTEGKKYPYLYTQGQAILSRTWIPSQDSPSNRITYSAEVKVPKELMALMSAENPTNKNEEGVYKFEMNQPIPVYLIALAVGNLEYKKLGEKCGVYTEPEMIDAVSWEFQDIEKMIVAAENLYGKYLWDQYDVIVLPYSFPYGGMENPRLTFANPTLIAGDRSLISVIAHELAHSWSGNLVTNATWEDFWLNEGFTVYFENRIMEAIYGKETADMLALIEFQELEIEMEEIHVGKYPKDTHLKLALVGRDPDEGMTSIAYVKGAFFLKTLEETAGRTKFDEFLKGYFSQFKFQTITTEIFESYLNDKLLTPNKIEFNTKDWLYGQGIPSNCAKISSKRFDEVQSLADKFASGKNIFADTSLNISRNKFITQEWLAFVRRLPRNMNPKQMALLDQKLNFKGWGNAEIMTEWFVLGIQVGYYDIRPDMEKFLMKIGRRKFLQPIYKALSQNKNDLEWARKVYNKAKINYHSVSNKTIEDILKIKS